MSAEKKQKKSKIAKMCKKSSTESLKNSSNMHSSKDGISQKVKSADVPLNSVETDKASKNTELNSTVSSVMEHNETSKKHKKKHKEKIDGSELTQSVEPISHVEKSDEDLSAQIKSDNDFFMGVIDMIPPQFYFDDATQEDILEMRASGGAMKKGQKSKFSGDDGGHQVAMKRARFNPDLNQTSHQMAHHFQQTQSKGAKPLVRHPAERGVTDHMEEVREKLRQKLEELKKQRMGGSLSKGLYNSEKSKLKRRENKLKRKMKLKLEKKHKTAPIPKINGDLPVKATKPIFNKDGKLVFSKFDFTDLSDKDKDKPKSEFTGKNYQKLLAKVERRNEKLKKLKETNPEKGENMEEKLKWQSALNRAEGLKVKDNPEMLKKAAKKKEKVKQARQKKWEGRQERTEKMMDDRQQKREKNIKAQKHRNLDKKVQKLKKKGRLIPGF